MPPSTIVTSGCAAVAFRSWFQPSWVWPGRDSMLESQQSSSFAMVANVILWPAG